MNRQSEYKVQTLESEDTGVWRTIDMYDGEAQAVAKAMAAAEADISTRFRVITVNPKTCNIRIYWLSSKTIEADKQADKNPGRIVGRSAAKPDRSTKK